MELQSIKIKEALKRQLRTRKIGYAEVAEHLGCSVPTIKRILGPEEMTLSRLGEILELLGLSLAEIEMLANEGKVQERSFSPNQQEFLLKNKSSFAYLLQLYNGLTPKQIATKYNLNQRSTDKYLIGLERAELIRVTGRQKVKTAHQEIPRLGRGPLGNAYFEHLIRLGSDFFIRWIDDNIHTHSPSDEKPPTHYAFQVSKITPDSYARFSAELAKLVQEFTRVSSFEEKTLSEEQLKTAVLMVGNLLAPSDYKPLTAIDEVFGPVTPL